MATSLLYFKWIAKQQASRVNKELSFGWITIRSRGNWTNQTSSSTSSPTLQTSLPQRPLSAPNVSGYRSSLRVVPNANQSFVISVNMGPATAKVVWRRALLNVRIKTWFSKRCLRILHRRTIARRTRTISSLCTKKSRNEPTMNIKTIWRHSINLWELI